MTIGLFHTCLGDEPTIRTVEAFSQALKTLDQNIEVNHELNNPTTLLTCPQVGNISRMRKAGACLLFHALSPTGVGE